MNRKITFILPLLLLIIAATVVITSCSKDDMVLNNTNVNDRICPPFTTPIYAGQTTEVGYIKVWNDNTNLYVKYVFNSPYYANWLHVWVGCNLANVPQNNGNPAPGLFPYHYNLNGGTTHTFTIPLSALTDCAPNFGCDNNPVNVYILAHSEVLGPNGFNETGWGYTGNLGCGKSCNQQWSGNQWGWITCYEYCCTENPPQMLFTSETAFAKPTIAQGGYVFAYDNKANPENYPSLKLSKLNWGWAGNINVNNLPQTYTLWANAGSNIISGAINAGSVTISKSGTNLIVTYMTTGTIKFEQVHIYLNSVKPTTTAPGQFGNTYNFTATNYKQFILPLPSGTNFWFIGHTVAQIPAN